MNTNKFHNHQPTHLRPASVELLHDVLLVLEGADEGPDGLVQNALRDPGAWESDVTNKAKWRY